eukprot:gene3963-7900_t
MLNMMQTILLVGVIVTGNQINPSRLLIATVLDPYNDEIVRDLFTMLRSLRIKGGSLNAATLLVCIAINSGEIFIDDNNLISNLQDLEVEITFIDQVLSPLPKTLNKFSAFKDFDEWRFDYFLWLDADTVIFDDPIPHIHAHIYPGQIQCVSDLYSYMSRYPHVNRTNLVWNPALSSFRMLGDGDNTPHGHCNTGVLLFDRMTLHKFLNTLEDVIEDINKLNKFKNDRFLDSLYFVGVVNKLGIDVQIMGYEMNYMGMFEVEILEDTDTSTNNLFIGHFVSNTTFYCHMKNNTNNEINSCVILPPATEYFPRNRPEQQEQQQESRSQHSPLSNQSVQDIRYNIDNNLLLFDLQPDQLWELQWPLNGSIINNFFPSEVSFSLHIAPITSTSTSIKPPVFGSIIIEVMDISNTTVYCNVSSAAFQFPSDGLSPLTMEVSFFIDANTCVPISFLTIRITMIRYVDNMTKDNNGNGNGDDSNSDVNGVVSARSTAYSFNPMLGSKPISMESQLQLATYLNMRSLSGIGVTICCDTYRGIQTVSNLIKHWNGNYLWIIITSVPYGFRSSGGDGGSGSNDNKNNYNQYLSLLRDWYSKVNYLGIIIGSRYIHSFYNPYISPTSTSTSSSTSSSGSTTTAMKRNVFIKFLCIYTSPHGHSTELLLCVRCRKILIYCLLLRLMSRISTATSNVVILCFEKFPSIGNHLKAFNSLLNIHLHVIGN